MNLIERVKNILLQPKSEWPKIAEEAATPQSLYLGYVAILAAIGPLAILIRSGGMAIVAAIVQYMIALVVTFLLALIVDALATTFGGEKNFVQSLKLTAYSYTAAWLAGRLTLDAGAVRALAREGKSLLPIGVVACEGQFERGEMVGCCDPDGREIARGLVNYSAAETQRILRRPSSEIETILGYVDEPELIHRDNLVLLA